MRTTLYYGTKRIAKKDLPTIYGVNVGYAEAFINQCAIAYRNRGGQNNFVDSNLNLRVVFTD